MLLNISAIACCLFCLLDTPLVKPLQQFPASYQQKKEDMLLIDLFFLFVICLSPECQTRR